MTVLCVRFFLALIELCHHTDTCIDTHHKTLLWVLSKTRDEESAQRVSLKKEEERMMMRYKTRKFFLSINGTIASYQHHLSSDSNATT